MNMHKPPIVLVHGAWHGAWCWRRMIPRLEAAGHAVFAPTLTGLADRAHLLSPAVNLETHIQDVFGVLEAEELENVVLVGHSYAGMVITAVADRARERLRSLVYLDAFLPENGRALIDYLIPAYRSATIAAGERDGYTEPRPATHFGLIEGTSDLAWVTRRMTRHPYATMCEPVRLSGPPDANLARTYIYCSKPATGTFDQFAAKLRADPGWRFHELAAGHDCMVTAPEETARLILAA